MPATPPLLPLSSVDARLLRVVQKLLSMPPLPPETPEQRAQRQAQQAQEEADRLRRVQNAAPPVVDPDTDLRLEVIELLVQEGKARHVAADLTNTRQKLHAHARRLGLL
jgi:hypothetical protein